MCLVNVEDSPDEMISEVSRSHVAATDIAPREIVSRLKVVSGDIALCLVRRGRGGSGIEIDAPTIDTLVEVLKHGRY